MKKFEFAAYSIQLDQNELLTILDALEVARERAQDALDWEDKDALAYWEEESLTMGILSSRLQDVIQAGGEGAHDSLPDDGFPLSLEYDEGDDDADSVL